MTVELRDKLLRTARQLIVLIQGVPDWQRRPAYQTAVAVLRWFIIRRRADLATGNGKVQP